MQEARRLDKHCQQIKADGMHTFKTHLKSNLRNSQKTNKQEIQVHRCLLSGNLPAAGLHGNSGVRAQRRSSRHSKSIDPFIPEACLLPFRSAESHYDFAVTGNEGEKRVLPLRMEQALTTKGSHLAFYRIPSPGTWIGCGEPKPWVWLRELPSLHSGPRF